MPPRLLSFNDDIVIPEVSWPVVRSRLARMWTIRDAPHHSLIGQTRSGKSYLTRYGILDTCKFDRVLIIDCKGDDPSLEGLGHVVNRFPQRTRRITKRMLNEEHRMFGPNGGSRKDRESKAESNWFRLVTSPDRDKAIGQVGEALHNAYHEGDWVVVVDELRYVCGTRDPNLNLEPQWQQITLRGGSKGVGFVNLTQEPRWVPGSFYTQSSFYWFSRIEDEAALKRVSEVGSSRALLPILARIPRRKWIYTDNLEDERYWALTQVTGGPK